MTTPTWPTTLPQLMDQDDLTIATGDAPVVSMQTESGDEMRRPRSGHLEEEVGATFRMTDSQFATFQTFVRDTLAKGTRRFHYTDPQVGASVLMRFAGRGGWSAKRVGTIWHVACRWIRRIP